ncbi:MAG: DUF4388 domain-containing protein [Planctomycetes bacterium]|nr:DUF4388 domain-containing protein [Planctomycetota bacterium]
MLQLLSRGRHTGVLNLATECPSDYGPAVPAAARIAFHAGKIVHASGGSRMRLGNQLTEKGVLSREAIRCLLNKQRHGDGRKPFGALLLEERILCPDGLKDELRAQILQVVELVLGWRHGLFCFDNTCAVSPETMPGADEGFSMELVLLEVHRQRDEAVLATAEGRR